MGASVKAKDIVVSLQRSNLTNLQSGLGKVNSFIAKKTSARYKEKETVRLSFRAGDDYR